MSEQYTKAGITVSKQGALQIIKFDNETKKNAICNEAYEVIIKALQEAAEDSEIVVTAFTGAGDYYSSGFNISSSANLDFDESLIKKSIGQVREFISVLIDHPKLLVAIVNGPALGIAVTTLALCDVVLASERATFRTPFTHLGLSAEGCSSLTFPAMLGPALAGEMLLLGRALDAREALAAHLVSQLYREEDVQRVWEQVREYTRLPPGSLQATKGLMRRMQADRLHLANRLETDELIRRLSSEEFMAATIAFLSRRQPRSKI